MNPACPVWRSTARAANHVIVDFWRWGLGNLVDHTNRGVLAKWLVGTVLGLPMDEPRSGWDRRDLRTPSGLGIEVSSWETGTPRPLGMF